MRRQLQKTLSYTYFLAYFNKTKAMELKYNFIFKKNIDVLTSLKRNEDQDSQLGRILRFSWLVGRESEKRQKEAMTQ